MKERQEPRYDGTVTAGTWKKCDVMKSRKLPPMPEERLAGNVQLGKGLIMKRQLITILQIPHRPVITEVSMKSTIYLLRTLIVIYMQK